MNELPNYYAVIPASVRYDTRLRANEKLLFGEITALTYVSGECWASNKYFAELYKVTTQAVSKWIANLKKCGYIELDYKYKGNGKEIEKRIIRLSPKVAEGYQQKFMGVSTKVSEGYQQKVKENNTSISNITSIIYIVEYLNEKLGTNYKYQSKDTQRHINARLNDGFSVEDFKTVIDKKYEEWSDTDMAKYLRPATLFGTKFEAYLNQREKDNGGYLY